MILTRSDFNQLGDAAVFYDEDGPGLAFAHPDPPGSIVEIVAAPSFVALPTQGYAHGLLSLTYSRLLPDEFSSGSDEIGVACLLSQQDFSVAGTGYSLGYHPVNTQLILRKMTNGLAAGTILDARFLGVDDIGDVSLTLLWLVDPYAANWVYLRVFAAGQRLYGYQDFAPPLPTSPVSEGYYYDGGGSGKFTFAFLQAALAAEI